MVSTKHCCWGQCKSDSRYPEKLPKSLKDMKESGRKIFLPFPKPSQGIEKCQRWITACSRENFDISKISRNTYICALHWPGEKGPTADHPDTLKGTFTPKEIKKASAPKRKAPKARLGSTTASKKFRLDGECDVGATDGKAMFTNMAEPEELDDIDAEGEYLSPSTGNMVLDRGTQTEYSNYVLSAKVETMVLRNKVATRIDDSKGKVVTNLSYENMKKDSQSMKHFVGLTTDQFEALYSFLDDVCPLNDIVYWKAKESIGLSKGDRDSKCSNREKLFICLLRLRRGFTIKTVALLLSSSERKIGETMLRQNFTTFIQLMFKIFRDSDVSNQSCLEAIIAQSVQDEFAVLLIVQSLVSMQTSRNFARQGNTYSAYKHSNTFKCLIAVTPNGGACFVSDLFEGDIGDVQIFKESGILKHINPGDIVLADRGFTVQHLLNPLQAHLKIPAFLKGRSSLSAAEELETRKIAKARIHVERFNERLKQFRQIGRKIPVTCSSSNSDGGCRQWTG